MLTIGHGNAMIASKTQIIDVRVVGIRDDRDVMQQDVVYISRQQEISPKISKSYKYGGIFDFILS